MYVVFDVETTGLSFKKDKIIEISAVELDENLQNVREFYRVVKQNVRITKEITELTGITNQEMNAKGQPEEEVFRDFVEFVGDQTLVAHNASFDLSMLYATIGTGKFYDFYDTLGMAQFLLRWINKHKLNLVCHELNVDLSRHHRSLYDTRATAEVFFYLKRMADVRRFDFENLLVLREEEEFVFPHRTMIFPMERPKVFAV